jgi:hypothetical protein
MSCNLEASTSWTLRALSRPVMGFLYLFTRLYYNNFKRLQQQWSFKNKCSKRPPSHCMHTACRYATECCHCTRCWYKQRLHLWSLLTDAFLLVCLRNTLDFMQPHRKISNGFQSCDRAGQATGLLPIDLPLKFSLKNSVTFLSKCGGAHSSCSHIHHVERGTPSKYRRSSLSRKCL